MTVKPLAILLLFGALLTACRNTASPVPPAPSAAADPTNSPHTGVSPERTAGAATTPPAGTGSVYYVRTDGGTADQCNGTADAAYSAERTPACAWNHPFWALPPGGEPRIAGGDSLIIASGDYAMGFGSPGAERCDAESAYECHMPPIPSGPDSAHPTRILGAGWDEGCPSPPELWGTERSDFILNLDGSSRVAAACLEITDHSDCVEFQEAGAPCPREAPPFGPWASAGIFAEDSSDVRLSDLNIHGLASDGVRAGRLRDWTVENVRIAANGWAGWDGDIGADSSNAGTLFFRRWRVEWNGCGETYPAGEPVRCWAQSAGGYGDGVGTGTTGGRWIIEDSAFLHNTSDGLDLLYAREPGASVEIRRTIAEGNAGNQIKLTGPARLENVIAIGNCAFFDSPSADGRGDGAGGVDPCRAGGDAVSLDLNPGDRASLINSTLTGEGNCLVIASCAYQKDCSGNPPGVTLTNDLFQGNASFVKDGEPVCFAWFDDETDEGRLPGNPFRADHSLFADLAFGNVEPCPGEFNLCGLPAGLVSSRLDSFDAHLQSGSPVIDAGTPDGAPPTDFDGRPRDGRPDIGAYEWQSSD